MLAHEPDAHRQPVEHPLDHRHPREVDVLELGWDVASREQEGHPLRREGHQQLADLTLLVGAVLLYCVLEPQD